VGFCSSQETVSVLFALKPAKMSLRAVSAELAKQGFLNERGAPFNHKSIAAMLAA